MGDGSQGVRQDQLGHISRSIFLTNFPDNFNARDLWKTCEGYGKVVDVFIPNRRSKSGKRFAFARFIRVDDIQRLVDNLCTIWNGRYHLHANVVRYERPRKPYINPGRVHDTVHATPGRINYGRVPNNMHAVSGSYASVLKGNTKHNTPIHPASPLLVLDDSYLVERDLSRHVMGRVTQLNSIPNLCILLAREGFLDVNVSYLGGMWVMIELLNDVQTKKFLNHTGVNSWFHTLHMAKDDFVSDERIVWVDIEGVPLHAWSQSTFMKIGWKWGETMDMEEASNSSFARKRICIRTNQEDNILEKFKINIRGKVYIVRAKELFAWTPIFLENKELGYVSGDELIQRDNSINKGKYYDDEESDHDSDEEGVSETIFENKEQSAKSNTSNQSNGKTISEDPFNIYALLEKQAHSDLSVSGSSSIPFPPGYTPEEGEISQENTGDEVVKLDEKSQDNIDIEVADHISHVHASVMGNSQNVSVDGILQRSSSYNSSKRVKHEGSILEVMDDMIRVGRSMGYAMEGCMKDIEHIVGLQGAQDGLK